MFLKRIRGPVSVKLPDGQLLTRSDLPPANTRRWVARRKAIVATAVAHGLISFAEACDMYGLSHEELEGWLRTMARHGKRALRATKVQDYRQLQVAG